MLRDYIECVQVCLEGLLCLCEWFVSDGLKQAAVVEPIDLFEGFQLDLLHRFP